MFSYDPSLSSELDWVRRLTGDTVDSGHALEDEEIAAFLDVEPNRYYAAAEALSAMLVRWRTLGAGVVEKRVDDLHIRREEGEAADISLRKEVDRLRARGATYMMPRPKIFRTLDPF